MNISTGVFTAPKAGMYFLSVALVKSQGYPQLIVQLRVNGNRIADARVYSQAPAWAIVGFGSTQVNIKLKKGDKVDVYKKEGILITLTSTHTFMSWLVEEGFE